MSQPPGIATPELITGKALQRRRLKALGIGCGVLVALPIVLILALLGASTVQLWRIQRKADSIRTGMPAAEAVAKAEFWYVLWITTDVHARPGYKVEPTGDGRYTISDITTHKETTYNNLAEFQQALTQAISGDRWLLQFQYATVMPRQVQFVVELDEHGRVAKVGEATAGD